LGYYAEGGAEGRCISGGGVKPAIKELRSPNVRLLTTEDLIVFSPEGTTSFIAVKVENKGNGVEVSIVKETRDGHLAFRDAVLDDHGTIEAAIYVLSRPFRWEKITQTARFGTPVWELRMKRDYEDFDLFVIVHWADWNRDGIRWKKRHDLAGEKFPVLGCRMKLKTFTRRSERLGLIYRLGKVKREKGNKTRP
jgi:hypothetical protein